jgi:hypothetical protein
MTPASSANGKFAVRLKKLWPHGDNQLQGLVDGIIAAAPAVFAKYQVETGAVVVIIMAQFSEECGGGIEMVENMNYFSRSFTAGVPVPSQLRARHELQYHSSSASEGP